MILNVEHEFVKEEMTNGIKKLINSFYTDIKTVFEVSFICLKLLKEILENTVIIKDYQVLMVL